jgi:hypothetical protein
MVVLYVNQQLLQQLYVGMEMRRFDGISTPCEGDHEMLMLSALLLLFTHVVFTCFQIYSFISPDLYYTTVEVIYLLM